MKVNVNELQIKRAKNREDVSIIKSEYGDGMDEITYESFRQCVPFGMADGALVILHNEKPIAMCIYSGRTIYGVCTSRNYRENGICHLLMEECIKDMKEVLLPQNEEHIKLFSNNPVAQKIYESFGFVCTGGSYNKFYELKI